MSHPQAANRYLMFSLGSETYAIPLLSVKEVIAVPEITSMPFVPSYFLGLINLRGQVLSAIDLRMRFRLPAARSPENSMIILDLGPTQVGILVDSVIAVVAPQESEICEPPSIEGSHHTEFVSGVFRNKEGLVLLIDIEKILTHEDRRNAV